MKENQVPMNFLLEKITRRKKKELTKQICYAGIKRWTDGRVWSPSRILGNFLIYRELDKKSNNNGQDNKKMSISSTSSNELTSPMTAKRSFSIDSTASMDRNKERQLVGSLSDSYRFKEDGLIKKTMSIIVNGVAQHLISYYDPNEVLQEKLRAPSSVPELASLEISPELLVKQNFRIPPLVEPTFDSPQHPYHHQGGHVTPPTDNTTTTTRMMHPLRSMSVGSIRSGGLTTDINQHLMYSSSTTFNNNNNSTTTTTTPHSPTTTTTTNHFNIPNSVYSNSNTTNMPSPSSLSSSPSTPMLNYQSSTRQSFNQQQHQRHYSASSVSSNSLPRFDPRNYSSSSSSSANHDNDNERFASPPNLGQLLNPIHPLNNTVNNNNSSNNDLFGGITHSSYNDYSNNGSSSLRNSISSQHEDNTPTPTPTTTTTSTSQDNLKTSTNVSAGANTNTTTGGGGGSGGLSDYMHYYQRQQPLTNTHHGSMNNHHHVMFQDSNDQLSFMNHTNTNSTMGGSQDHQNNDLEHFMLK